MRFKTEELYSINPKEFIGMAHELVLEKKADALLARKKKLAQELRDADIDAVLSYEVVSAINSEIKYLDGGISDNLFFLDEMGVGYTPKDD